MHQLAHWIFSATQNGSGHSASVSTPSGDLHGIFRICDAAKTLDNRDLFQVHSQPARDPGCCSQKRGANVLVGKHAMRPNQRISFVQIQRRGGMPVSRGLLARYLAAARLAAALRVVSGRCRSNAGSDTRTWHPSQPLSRYKARPRRGVARQLTFGWCMLVDVKSATRAPNGYGKTQEGAVWSAVDLEGVVPLPPGACGGPLPQENKICPGLSWT